MDTNPSPDVVEALQIAIEDTDDVKAVDTVDAMNIIFELKRQGFTITRQPAMTDTELINAIEEILYGDDISGADDTHLQALALIAKKYGG